MATRGPGWEEGTAGSRGAVAQWGSLLMCCAGPAPRGVGWCPFCCVCLMSTPSLSPWSQQRGGRPHSSIVRHGPCGVLDGASCPSRPCWALTSSAWSLVPEPHLPDPDRPGKPTLPETASPCSPAWPRARALFLLMVGSGRWKSRLPSTHSSAQTTGPVSEPPRLPLCTCWYPPSQRPVGHYVWIRSRFSSSVWD